MSTGSSGGVMSALKKMRQGTEYLEFNERDTKTRTGDDVRNIRQVKPRMWPNKADPSRCPVLTYKHYARKRPVLYSEPHHPFYIASSSRFSEADAVVPDHATWFRAQPVGQNKLSHLMSNMSQNAGLRHLTNHSARKHLVQKLNNAGVHPNHIMQVTGHKNIQSINNYSHISLNQQRGISNIISSALTSSSTATPTASPTVSSSATSSTANTTAACSVGSSVETPAASSTVPCAPFPESSQHPHHGTELFEHCQIRVEKININISYNNAPRKRRRINVIESYSSSQEN